MTVKVKICGITREQDALSALDLGADFIGLVFYSKSPRHVSLKQAQKILEFLKTRGLPSPPAIGVFVNEEIDIVRQTVETLGLFAAQLHGEESPEYCASLPFRIIKAFRTRDAESLGAVDQFHVWAYLCDAFHPDLHGGTGKRIDASLLAPYIHRHRMFLAGGLSPENISSILKSVSPYGVDVSTGVEERPGIKDPEKIRAFISAVKGASQPL